MYNNNDICYRVVLMILLDKPSITTQTNEQNHINYQLL